MALLKPTRQRMILMELIFGAGGRHMSADDLFAEASGKVEVSLATVYNTLHELQRAGLVRPISINNAKVMFDSNMANHHHFYDEASGRLFDIPEGSVVVATPPAPPGYLAINVDVLIRLTPIEGSSPAA